jgi:hypothetical protein
MTGCAIPGSLACLIIAPPRQQRHPLEDSAPTGCKVARHPALLYGSFQQSNTSTIGARAALRSKSLAPSYVTERQHLSDPVFILTVIVLPCEDLPTAASCLVANENDDNYPGRGT